MTRSTILSAKVTPQALTAWRSTGASRRATWPSLPWCSAVVRTTSARSQRRASEPLTCSSRAAGSSLLNSCDTVGAASNRSTRALPSTRTGRGPEVSGSQIRPTRSADAASSGSTFSSESKGLIVHLRRSRNVRQPAAGCATGSPPAARAEGRRRARPGKRPDA